MVKLSVQIGFLVSRYPVVLSFRRFRSFCPFTLGFVMNTFQRLSVLALSTSLLIAQPTLVLARSAYRTSEPAAGLSGAAASAARAEARARALKQQGKNAPYANPVPNSKPAPAPKQAAPVVPNKKGVQLKGKYQMTPTAPVVAPLTNLPNLPPDNRVLATGLLSISVPEPVDSASVFTMTKLSDPATYPAKTKAQKVSKSSKKGPVKYDFNEVQTAGMSAFASADYDLAVQDFIKAVQSQPNREDSRHMLALSFARQGDFDKALESLNAVLNINPKNEAALFDRAYCNYRKGSFVQAVDDYNSVLAADSGLRQAKEGRIICYAKLRDLARIGDACRDYLDKYSGDVKALDLVGRACLFAGENQMALNAFQSETRFNTTDVLGLYGAARAIYGAGDVKGAIKKLEEKSKAGQLMKNETADMAYLLYLDGRYLKAFDTLDIGAIEKGRELPATGNDVLILYKTMEEALAAVRRGKATVDAYNYLSKGYRAGGDINSAILCAKQVIALTPNSANGYLALAACMMYNENYNAALPYISKALEIDPKSTSAYIARANCFLSEDKFKEALNDLQKACDIDPKQANNWANLSVGHRLLREYDKSKQDIDKALSLDSQDELIYLRLAQLYFAQGKQLDCIDVCNKLLTKNPTYADAYGKRGEAYFQLNLLDSAKENGQKLLALEPQNLTGVYLLGRTFRAYRQYPEAISYLLKAKEIKPSFSWSSLELGRCYLGLGQIDNAKKEFSNYIRLQKDSADSYEDVAAHFSRYHLYDDAISLYTQAVTLDAKNPERYYTRGFFYSGKGDVEAAIADFEKANSLKLDQDRFLEAKGSVLADNGRRDEAEAVYNQLVQLKNDYDNYSVRAEFYKDQGEEEKALADTEEWLKLKPTSTSAIMAKATLLNRMGKAKEGLDFFEANYPKPPENDNKKCGDYYSEYAYQVSHFGDLQRATELFERSYSYDSTPSSRIQSLIFIYTQTGDFNKVLEYSARARARYGFTASNPIFIFYTLPWYANMKLGRAGEANRLFQNLATENNQAWPRPIADFLSGNINEDTMMSKAISNGNKTEAHAWLALFHLANGRNAAAKPHLDWVMEKGSSSYMEVDLVRDAWKQCNPDVQEAESREITKKAEATGMKREKSNK